MFEKEDNSERRKACFWLFKYLSSLSRIKRTVLFVVHESFESAAMVKHFIDNYDIIANITPAMFARKIYLNDPVINGHRFCRFCQRNETKVKFRDDAHAISAMLGNKTVFVKSQCEDCNHFFGEYVEDGLAKYLGISRVLSQIPKRKGYPSYKSKDGKFRMDITENGTIIQATSDSSILNFHDTYIDFEAEREPYYPIDAYRTLLLSALSVIPINEVKPLIRDYIWLRADRQTVEGQQILQESHDAIVKYASKVFETFVPGPNPLPLRVIVCRRKIDAKEMVPHCFGVIQFQNYRFQFAIPSELDKVGNYSMKRFVGEEEVDPKRKGFIAKYGRPEIKTVDLSKHDKVYGEKIVRRISFVRKSEIDVKDGEQFLIEHNIKRLSPNCGEV